MSNKFASDLTSFAPKSSPAAQTRAKRPGAVIDPAQLVGQGMDIDCRMAFTGNWSFGQYWSARPVSPSEFDALFYYVAALPGVPRPLQYGAMCCELHKAPGTVERKLYSVSRRTWLHLSEKYYSDQRAPFCPDWRWRGRDAPRPIYSDTIRADACYAVAL